jgi:hypothetical protein
MLGVVKDYESCGGDCGSGDRGVEYMFLLF